MTGGPGSGGTALSLTGLPGLTAPPGCTLILVGAPGAVPFDCCAVIAGVGEGPSEPVAPPHAAAATRIAMIATTFFIRRPPVYLRSELSDQTLDVAARNICQRAAGQESRHRRGRAPGAVRRELQRGARRQGRVGRPQRRRQDEPVEGPGGRKRSCRRPRPPARDARLPASEPSSPSPGVADGTPPHPLVPPPRRPHGP